MKPHTLSGLLVVDKPGGMTSRAAVNRVQQWFPRGTRIGHTGTLDPLATGVLVVCIGTATRLAEYVQAMSKTYVAGLRLGATSDTDDVDGTIAVVEGGKLPDMGEVTAALASFVGEIQQLPPQFSAAKVAGQRAYDLARRGHAVSLQPRTIAIYGIDIMSSSLPHLQLQVCCGKGTYIRSLARDLGDKLGCGGLIETLRRTRVGPFLAENAVSFDADAIVARDRLLPLEMAVAELPRIVVDARMASDLMHGRAVAMPGQKKDQDCAAFGQEGTLIAIGKWNATRRLFEPTKVMAVAG